MAEKQKEAARAEVLEFQTSIGELREEVERSGLVCERIVGIESPIAIIKRLDDWVDKKGRTYELAVKYAQMVEEEEELLGASFHLLGVGRRT